MMYSNRFVVVVKNENGEILRESKNKEVFLPFNSHYSLLLKNKHNRRALASVFIDGMDALGGNSLIIQPNSDINLERFCLDGNLSAGNKFKFVEKNHPEIQDPESSSLGDVEVVFKLEKEEFSFPETPKIPIRSKKNSDWRRDIVVPSIPDTSKYWENEDSISYFSRYGDSAPSYKTFSTLSCKTFSTAPIKNVTGGTVEGSYSNQCFVNGYIGDLENDYTSIKIRIKPHKNSLTVKKTKHIYCSCCGTKNSRKNNYCTNCGTELKF